MNITKIVGFEFSPHQIIFLYLSSSPSSLCMRCSLIVKWALWRTWMVSRVSKVLISDCILLPWGHHFPWTSRPRIGNHRIAVNLTSERRRRWHGRNWTVLQAHLSVLMVKKWLSIERRQIRHWTMTSWPWIHVYLSILILKWGHSKRRNSIWCTLI